MTRAMVCLIKGDFAGYVKYNFMALPTLIVVYFCIHQTKKTKMVTNILAYLVGVGVMIRYLIIIT